MNTNDLLQRIQQHLGTGADVYWTPADLVANGLNVSQRMLVLLKPTLLTQRVLVNLAIDQVYIDVRQAAPRLVRVERVALGDVTGERPIPSNGAVGDLRKTTLDSLRTQKHWFLRRASLPTHWYPHGLEWVCTWPRATQTVQLTLVGRMVPTALSSDVLDQVPDLPVQEHPLLADLGAALVQLTEGANTCEQAVQRIGQLIGNEPLVQPLLKALRAQKYRYEAQQAKAQA